MTHDINEAIKMGDKIAIFNAGKLVQFGTPEEILTKPKNAFVENFIGHDRVVKKLNLYCVEEAMQPVGCLVRKAEFKAFVQTTTSLPDALSLLLEFDSDYLGVLKGEELCGMLSFKDIRRHVYRKEGE